MLNITIILVGTYLLFTLLTAVFAYFFNKNTVEKVDSPKIGLAKVFHISNAALGTSLMVSFMSTLIILQLDAEAQEKALYLLLIYAICYILAILVILYSHIGFKSK